MGTVMSDRARFLQANMVRFQRTVAASARQIWDVLTDTGRLPQWYGEGAIEPRAGGAVTLMAGRMRGVVTQWQPPGKLAYTWNVFMPGQTVSDYPESYLTFEVADGKLALTHLPVLDEFVTRNAVGWHTFLDMAEAELKGEPRQPREIYARKNAELYGVTLPS
jgi:uncharacterized protein YndB with AHSA1/START domain